MAGDQVPPAPPLGASDAVQIGAPTTPAATITGAEEGQRLHAAQLARAARETETTTVTRTAPRAGFRRLLVTLGVASLIPIVPRAHTGWALVASLLVVGCGLGLLVSQLNNYTLAPIAEQRVSEAAGVNSAGGSFGLSFGLAFAGAIMLAVLSLSFTNMAQSSSVLSKSEQQQVATALKHDAQVVSNTELEKQLAGRPQKTQDEIIRINTRARHVALQVALLIPILAGLLGLLVSLRMMRLPDPEQSGKQAVLG